MARRPGHAPRSGQAQRSLLAPAEAAIAIALIVLLASVVTAWLRAPDDPLVLVQAVALGAILIGLAIRQREVRRISAQSEERDAGLTRILQGLSRSLSSEAIVQAIVMDLLRTARADHVVVARPRATDGRVEATLVSAKPDVPTSTVEFPPEILERALSKAAPPPARGQLRPAGRQADVIAAEIARHVRSAYGLANTLAAPLVVDDRLIGALVLSRRAKAWTPADRRLIGWAAQEASAALARAQAFEEAETQAKFDSLTGLPNRRHLEELVAAAESGRRAGDSIGVLMIDIDHFKQLNDRYGHGTGDAVLRAVAEEIALTVRASDTPARYGGEEFAVLLRHATADQALEVGERIRRAIAAIDPTDMGIARPVTVSVGVAVGHGPETDVRSLFEAADGALYRAKREGRNRVAQA